MFCEAYEKSCQYVNDRFLGDVINQRFLRFSGNFDERKRIGDQNDFADDECTNHDQRSRRR